MSKIILLFLVFTTFSAQAARLKFTGEFAEGVIDPQIKAYYHCGDYFCNRLFNTGKVEVKGNAFNADIEFNKKKILASYLFFGFNIPIMGSLEYVQIDFSPRSSIQTEVQQTGNVFTCAALLNRKVEDKDASSWLSSEVSCKSRYVDIAQLADSRFTEVKINIDRGLFKDGESIFSHDFEKVFFEIFDNGYKMAGPRSKIKLTTTLGKDFLLVPGEYRIENAFYSSTGELLYYKITNKDLKLSNGKKKNIEAHVILNADHPEISKHPYSYFGLLMQARDVNCPDKKTFFQLYIQKKDSYWPNESQIFCK